VYVCGLYVYMYLLGLGSEKQGGILFSKT
jgi:hypothetical protein